jgi:hypothetical protein
MTGELKVMRSNDTATLKLIDKILHDPLLLKKLSDRVYQLIQDDHWNQCDRDRNYYIFKERI